MATMQTRADDVSPTEFILAGRYWLTVGVTVVCAVAAIYFHMTRDHPWVGLHSLPWRAAGISLEARQELYAAVFAFVALSLFVWTLVGPRIARRVVIHSTSITIYGALWGSGEPVVVPFAAIRDAGLRERPPGSGRSAIARRADKYFHFSFNGRNFDFRRFAFQSDRDFDRFCQLIGSRAGYVP